MAGLLCVRPFLLSMTDVVDVLIDNEWEIQLAFIVGTPRAYELPKKTTLVVSIVLVVGKEETLSLISNYQEQHHYRSSLQQQ